MSDERQIAETPAPSITQVNQAGEGMTQTRSAYGRVSDLLDNAKTAMAQGAVFDAIEAAETAIRIMRATQEIRQSSLLAPRGDPG